MRIPLDRTASWTTLPAVLIAALFFGVGACTSQESDGEAEAGTAAASASEAEDELGELADPASFPEIVASVNGTEIPRADLIDRVLSIERQRGGSSPETTSLAFYRQVLDEIVGAELLFQESQERDLTADTAEVEGQVNGIRGRFPDAQVFEQALSSQGMTLDGLRAQISRDLSIQKLIETDITPTVAVSEEDKRKFYDDNVDRMREPEQLRLSHILKRVDPSGAPADREKARIAIEQVLTQARDGVDFATLARDHSEDPGSAANGGEMMVTRGQTVPPFEQAAFALEPGSVSDVVETRFGFHIIKLHERTEGRVLPYAEIEGRLGDVVQQQKLAEAVESVVTSLKDDSEVELFI